MVAAFKICLVLLFSLYSFANEITPLEFKELGFNIVKNNLDKSSFEFNKKYKYCESLENNIILEKDLFKNLKLNKRDLGIVLLHFSLKAKKECIKNEFNSLFSSYSQYVSFLKLHNFYPDKLQDANLAMEKLFSSDEISIKTNILYRKIANEETKRYLESLDVLKYPFNLSKTLEQLK